MKYLISILILTFSMTMGWAQQAFEPKVDGTKYYIQVYDGETNEKILYQNAAHTSWKTKIQLADFFDGSLSQLWTFKATVMYPGYYSVFNHDEDLTEAHHLMSWDWNAYLGSNRDPADSPEMQYRFIEVADGWYKFETIEKEAGLNGRDYTPGADALNVKPEGFVSFSEVKSADITPQNMINKVFRFVEFNPLTAYDNSLETGEKLYQSNPNAPEKARYDFFYTLEKGREVRVFGTESEILAYQDMVYEAIAKFNKAIEFNSMLADALAFINASDADSEVKASFTAIVNNADEAFNAGSLSPEDIEIITLDIAAAKEFVEAIIAAQTFATSLTGLDGRLGSAMDNSINNAKATLASAESNADAFNASKLHLEKMEDAILEINIANELIDGTQEFEEAKAALGAAIEEAIVAISNVDVTSTDLDVIIADLQEANKAFKKALEAGDTLVELLNADFESDLTDWIVDSPTSAAAYPSTKGVDGSKSVTCWSGSAYQMKLYQSLSNLPDGTYLLSAFISTNVDGAYKLFAESGTNVSELPISKENGLAKRQLQIDVVGGSVDFGVRGAGENNGLSAGNWVVLDDFELKWSSKLPVTNAGFEDGLTDWLVEGVTAAAYPENKGVDGSKSITCYRGVDYNISLSQAITGLTNGTYAVSAMAKTNQDGAFVVFGESAGVVTAEPVTGGQLVKVKTVVEVTDGTLKFGVKGAGENNAVPANNWIVFDNVEVVRMPDMPVVNADFENGLSDWLVEGVTAAAYPQNKGVDGSQSITCYRGEDYNISVSQTITGLANGTYAISTMAKTNLDETFVVFGESDGVVSSMPVIGNQLVKTNTLVELTDGTLKFGVKGGGDSNSVPAGKWIVFDNFEVKLKSIIPVYEVVVSTPSEAPSEMFVTGIESQNDENKVIYWQSNQRLNIQSTDAIVKCVIYSITGVMVEQNETRTNTLSIPMRRGVYVVRVSTENGFVGTEKVCIR